MIDLIEVRTSDLVGAALNWAVETAIGGAPEVMTLDIAAGKPPVRVAVRRTLGAKAGPTVDFMRLDYSTAWSHGGPLMDHFHISFREFAPGKVTASLSKYPFSGAWSRSNWKAGPTRLIAGCRAIVADLLGDSVQVPKDLVLQVPTSATTGLAI